MRQQSTAAPEKGRVAVGGGLFGIYGSDRIIWIVYIYIIFVCVFYLLFIYIFIGLHGYMYRLIWIYPCRIVKFNETIDTQGYNE